MQRFRLPVVALALIWPSIISLFAFVLLADDESVWKKVIFAGGKVLQFLLPVMWLFWAERGRSRWRPPGTAGLAPGLAFGLLVAGLGLLGYYLWLKPSEMLDFADTEIAAKIADFYVDSLWKYVVLAVFYSALHSLLEEYYWRWFVFGQLKKLCPLWPAIMISSLGFMAHHVIVLASFFGWDNPLSYLFSAGVAIGGGVWAWLYHKSGSLLGPWLSHALVDAGIFLVGYDMVGPF